MAKKNPDEEAAVKRARQQAKDEEATERKIERMNKKESDGHERLRKLLED